MDKERTIAGIKVPAKPVEPTDCCGTGCTFCILDDYREWLREWTEKCNEAKQALMKMPEEPWPADFGPEPARKVESAEQEKLTKTRDQAHYFGAGPALLPTTVLDHVASDLLNYNNLGIGVGEVSHRSSDGFALIDSTKQKIKQLYNIPDTHDVFFVQGGGTAGFSAVFYNMMASFAHKTGKNGIANYIVTGSWSQKAAEEAKRLASTEDLVNIVVDTKKINGKYGSVPDESTWKYSSKDEIAYVYYCDNETVHGVEFPFVPNVPEGVELVADMSSNFLSKKVDISKFGLIFGGAQKNIGIAGISLYIIKKSLLERLTVPEYHKLGVAITPIFMDFPSIASNNSAYNTIPLVPLDVVGLCMDYLIDKGGLEAQEAESDRKANKIYAVIDKYPKTYEALVEKKYRSRMNIVFQVQDLKHFLEGAKKLGLTGLAGHRSVGGVRVSNCEYKRQKVKVSIRSIVLT